MAASTSVFTGPPTSGFYTVGDTITDANNIVWQCVATGFAGINASGTAQFDVVNVVATIGVGAKTGSTVTVAESGFGSLHKTILTFTDTPVTITNGASEWTGTLIYTFPTAKILPVAAHGVCNLTTTSVIATSTNGATATMAFGSVTDDGTHTGTKADFCGDENVATSSTISVAAADTTFELDAAATTWLAATPQKIYMNIKCATDSINATLLVNGYFTLTWMADR